VCVSFMVFHDPHIYRFSPTSWPLWHLCLPLVDPDTVLDCGLIPPRSLWFAFFPGAVFFLVWSFPPFGVGPKIFPSWHRVLRSRQNRLDGGAAFFGGDLLPLLEESVPRFSSPGKSCDFVLTQAVKGFFFLFPQEDVSVFLLLPFFFFSEITSIFDPLCRLRRTSIFSLLGLLRKVREGYIGPRGDHPPSSCLSFLSVPPFFADLSPFSFPCVSSVRFPSHEGLRNTAWRPEG